MIIVTDEQWRLTNDQLLWKLMVLSLINKASWVILLRLIKENVESNWDLWLGLVSQLPLIWDHLSYISVITRCWRHPNWVQLLEKKLFLKIKCKWLQLLWFFFALNFLPCQPFEVLLWDSNKRLNAQSLHNKLSFLIGHTHYCFFIVHCILETHSKGR